MSEWREEMESAGGTPYTLVHTGDTTSGQYNYGVRSDKGEIPSEAQVLILVIQLATAAPPKASPGEDRN